MSLYLERCFNKNRHAVNAFLSCIEYHVNNHETSFRHDLTDAEKRNLVGLMLNALNDETLNDFWAEMPNVQKILKIFGKSEQNYTAQNKDDFYAEFSNAAIKHFEVQIQDLFDNVNEAVAIERKDVSEDPDRAHDHPEFYKHLAIG